jgi:tetratricopeptide (TPR) repeat protein
MSIPAIAPSPVARLLLELEARKATGGLDVGGRRIVLTEGAIVEVRPHAEDASLGDFLIATGRLTEEQLEAAKREASATQKPLETSLRHNDLVPVDVLLDTRRALWLDRFVRGLSSEESAGTQPGLLSPEPHASPGPAIGTLAFVLDALTRRAGFAGDAERVGRLAQAWFEWLDTPQRQRAAAWAELGEVSTAVFARTLFPRHPAAPPRIAALVRAGLARLSERRSQLPPPAPRNPGFAAPAPEARVEGPITARRAFPEALAAGTGRERRPLNIVPVGSWFPAPSGALNDPLETLERRIAQLEQAGAPPAERAQAWLELAHGLRNHFDSIDEAARASREAVAADPSCQPALELAASLCAATARPDLAFAYASGLAEASPEAATKAQVLLSVAEYANRADRPGSALRALRHAAELRPEDPAFTERYAHALLARGDLEQALRVVLAAAQGYRARKPEAARALLSWAHGISPYDPAIVTEFASALAAEGYGEAAVMQLVRAARHTPDAKLAQRLWREAGVRAEVCARPDLAADVLLEATLHCAPGDTSHVTSLLDALSASGATVELSVIGAEFSERARGVERAVCLLRAVEARLELPGDPALALELCIEALAADPGNVRALSVCEELAEASGAAWALSDALERALRAAPAEQAQGLMEYFLRLTADTQQPMLERWAWSLWSAASGASPSPEQRAGLEERMERHDLEIQGLRQALREADIADQWRVALRLAHVLRQDPEQRPRARKLYQKVLERQPESPEAEAGLESLLRLEGEHAERAGLLSRRVGRAPVGPARIAAYLALIHHERARGDLEAALRTCQELLSSAGKHREGLFLLQRLSVALRAPALERDALSRRVDAANDPRERARLLCALARSYWTDGDPAEAARRAELALAADPRCAEGALILIELHHMLDAPRCVAALRAARVVLGDTPQLLRLLAQACFGTADARGQLEALETLLRLCPFDPFPALGLAALRATGKDVPALCEAVRSLLLPERRCETSAEVVRMCLSRLWTLGETREAAELSIAAADALGELGSELVTWSLPYVREGDDARLGRALVERLVARAGGDSRRAELRRLAHLCRAQGARTAELRAYLRLLAVEPDDTEALDRLTAIYAETRELERLTAVLTLRLNAARDLDERRERLLSLALVSLELMADPASAQELVRAALARQPPAEGALDVPLSELRRGIGLLLASSAPRAAFDLLLELSEESSVPRSRQLLEEAIHVAEQDLHDTELALRAATLGLESHPFHMPFLLHFERLALDLSDVATAREVYRHLADAALGAHGRRAILYRASRFLERAGALTDALAMAEEAFMLAPSEGAVLVALSRYARATGEYEGLLRALVALAAEPTSGARRAELLSRAGSLCEEELKDVRRAAELHIKAFEAHRSDEHERIATTCLGRVAEHDLLSARVLFTNLRDVLTLKAKDSPSGAERASALLSLAELSLDIDQAHQDAASYAQAVKPALESAPEEATQELATKLKERLERVVARLPLRKEPRHSSAPAISPRAAEKPPMVSPKWSDPRRSQASYGYGRPSVRETLRPAALPAPLEAEPRTTLPGVIAPALPTAPRASVETTAGAWRGLRVEAGVTPLTHEEDALVQAIAAGQPEALLRLQEVQSTSIEHNAKLVGALLVRARKLPLNVVCLRGLWMLGERAHRKDVRAVGAELLSHVDPSIACTRTGRVPDPNDDVTKAALLEARDDGDLGPAFTVLAHLFLGAGPLFRRPLASYGVSTSDFIAARDDSAYAEALRDVSIVLGVEHEAYLTPSGKDGIGVVATYPPSIIVGDGTARAPIALRFRIGCAFERARPSSVLLSTLNPDAMATLLRAVNAAFGAADDRSASIDREAAAMAAELWRTLPNGTQKQISNILRAMASPPTYETLIEQMRVRALRVGLVTAGALDVALENLDLDGDPSGVRAPASEAALTAALLSRPLLARLLSFALSDAYLALRSRESS